MNWTGQVIQRVLRIIHPLIGALLNLLIFGAADLVAGQFRLAVAKILIFFALPFFAVAIIDWIDITFNSDILYSLTINVIMLIYIAVVTTDGYQTFRQAYGDKNSNPG